MTKRILIIISITVMFFTALPGALTEYTHALTTNIKVGYCAYFSPYQFIGSDGMPDGFNIDMLEIIAEKNDLVLEYIPFGTTAEAMDSLEKGDVDMVLGVIEGSELDYNVRLTNPLSTANICLVATQSTAEIYRRKEIIRGPVLVEFSLTRKSTLDSIASNNIIAGNQERSIDMFLEGHTNAMVAIKECILWRLEKENLNDEYEIINNYVESADIVIAVRDGDRLLCNEINDSISDLRTSSTYDDLYEKWFEASKVDYRRLFRIAIIVIGIAAFAVAAYLFAEFRRKAIRIEAENKLRYSIIESSPAAMILIDADYAIEYMNRSAMKMARITEYNTGNLVTEMNIFSNIIDKIGGNIFGNDWEYRNGTLEYYKKHSKSGKEKYRWNIQKITTYNGMLSALITVENTTVEEREREAAFEKEKNETLNSLIAGIAHEIKNPLTAINASAAMMEKKGHNEKFRQAFSEHIPQEIDRITRLIDNLLDYARPGASKIEEVSLPDIICSVYELSKVTAKRTQITMNICDEVSLIVRGDKDKLKQTLLNLMINSVEATKIQAVKDDLIHSITIECFAENNNAVVLIEDDGVGMTEQELENCTAPFWTTKKAGTGIGLALTKQYIEEAGGCLTINSAKNQFTCVKIQLPLIGSEEKN